MKKKKHTCKEVTTVFATSMCILGAYIFISFFQLLCGISDAEGNSSEHCNHLERIEYIFPAHALGCFAGSPVKPDNKLRVSDCQDGVYFLWKLSDAPIKGIEVTLANRSCEGLGR